MGGGGRIGLRGKCKSVGSTAVLKEGGECEEDGGLKEIVVLGIIVKGGKSSDASDVGERGSSSEQGVHSEGGGGGEAVKAEATG